MTWNALLVQCTSPTAFGCIGKRPCIHLYSHQPVFFSRVNSDTSGTSETWGKLSLPHLAVGRSFQNFSGSAVSCSYEHNMLKTSSLVYAA